MTIKLRFALLLGLLLGGLTIAHLIVRRMEVSIAEELTQMERQGRIQLLHHWVDATSRALPQFAADLAESGELTRLLSQSDAEQARARLGAALQAAGATWLWLVKQDGSLTFDAAATGIERVAVPPIDAANFAGLVAQTPSPRFFAEFGPELVEVCIRRVQPGGDAGTPTWIVVARRWDEAHVLGLGALTDSEASLQPPHAATRPSDDPTRIELIRPLPDWRGQPLRVLRLFYQAAEIRTTLTSTARQSVVLVVFGLLLLLALGLALQRWVLRPLRNIGESLAAQNAAGVETLTREKSELGRVAQLVVSSFAQRAELEREIAERRSAQAALERSEAALRNNLEERARLGRDLHDGVIQSLYAAGMGLAGIRMQLRPDQTEAATRLEQTRATLNETIHDVRNFIIGLEPEALKLQTFSHAVAALLAAVGNMREFRSSVNVDEGLAARLTLAQRVHALQIAREAVSNALRHGQATEITVNLQRSGEFAAFEVIDNGRGFEPASASAGKGLTNFSERARELGAELSIESQPGRGACVKLVFSLT